MRRSGGGGGSEAFEEVRIEFPGDEVRVVDDPLVQIDVGLDAFHDHLAQSTPQPGQGHMAVFPVHNQLGDQRVVERGCVSTRTPGPPGRFSAVISPGEGAKVTGSSALMRTSMA